MENLFLQNESAINIIAVMILCLSYYSFKAYEKTKIIIFNKVYSPLFVSGYLIILINSLINGIVKGF